MRRKRRKYEPKQIRGLTWKQKLSIEAALEYGIEVAEKYEDGLPQELQTFATPFRKVLAMFRKKTKFMRAPKRRRRLKRLL